MQKKAASKNSATVAVPKLEPMSQVDFVGRLPSNEGAPDPPPITLVFIPPMIN